MLQAPSPALGTLKSTPRMWCVPGTYKWTSGLMSNLHSRWSSEYTLPTLTFFLIRFFCLLRLAPQKNQLPYLMLQGEEGLGGPFGNIDQSLDNRPFKPAILVPGIWSTGEVSWHRG